jgi:hypothetical protein
MGTEPRDVIEYVLNRGPSGVPRWVSAADHADALILVTWCWWQDRRVERRMLRQGLHLGLSLGELGAPLGIRSRQGARDRLDRLTALLAYDRPDEKLSRAARREEQARDERQQWIDDRRAEVRAVIVAFLAQARRATGPEEVEPLDDQSSGDDWMAELASDVDEDQLSPATLAVAGLAAAELRSTRLVRELDRKHRLHATLDAVEELRTRFARMS